MCTADEVGGAIADILMVLILSSAAFSALAWLLVQWVASWWRRLFASQDRIFALAEQALDFDSEYGRSFAYGHACGVRGVSLDQCRLNLIEDGNEDAAVAGWAEGIDAFRGGLVVRDEPTQAGA